MNNAKVGIPVFIGILVVCLACVCCAAIALYFYGASLFGGDMPVPSMPLQEQPQSVIPADTSNLPEWTIIVYADADDEVLEGSIWFDVNEMEVIGSTPQVNIVVQLDRAAGGFDGDGNWTDTRRFYVTRDDDLGSITSPVVEYIGEANMSDPQTLIDFATWAMQNYPAKKYALIMSDHGAGWAPGWTDLDSGGHMSLPEITYAVSEIQSRMGGQKIELLGFDACLMGMLEVYGSLYPYTNYMVASQEVEPSPGWAYAGWLERLVQNPTVDGRALSQYIVSSYIVEDVALSIFRSPAEIADMEADTTLTAVESARIPDVIRAMNQFTTTLTNVNQEWVAQGRQYTRSYYTIFDVNKPSPYIDLVNFAEIMATTNDPAIVQSYQQLSAAVDAAVIAEKYGARMAGSNGISIHFPISEIYALTELSGQLSIRYADDAGYFLTQSSWDEFLAYHYLGQAYVPQEGQAFVPNRTAELVPPGASDLVVAPIQLSDTLITGDETLTLSTTITGNVSYIYFILMFYNPDADAYWFADEYFIIAPETMTVGGVNMPDFGPSPIQVTHEWAPTLWVLKDGVNEEFALFEPDEYLSAEGVTTYSLYGQYTPVGGAPMEAKLVFDPNGNLLNVYAFPDPDGDGISSVVGITPQIGDQFEDYVQAYYFDENNEPYFDYSLGGTVFTYGEQGFWFESRYPVDGEYAVGFYATDFDGNLKEAYEYFTYQFEP